MKQFKIYQNAQGTLEAVKQGWSWPAFLFGAIWALCKKLWVLGGCLLAFGLILTAIQNNSDSDGINLILNIGGIGLSFIFGSMGNKWRESNLISRGYDLKDTVTAANVQGAIALYTSTGHSDGAQ